MYVIYYKILYQNSKYFDTISYIFSFDNFSCYWQHLQLSNGNVMFVCIMLFVKGFMTFHNEFLFRHLKDKHLRFQHEYSQIPKRYNRDSSNFQLKPTIIEKTLEIWTSKYHVHQFTYLEKKFSSTILDDYMLQQILVHSIDL